MLLATFLLGAFIIHSLLTENIDDDDDDHFDSGILIPKQNPVQ